MDLSNFLDIPFKCVDSVLTIAACLSYKSPFVSPFSKRNEADAKKKEFAVCNSDQLTVLTAYKVKHYLYLFFLYYIMLLFLEMARCK